MTAEEFKAWRKSHGWTQEECADVFGFSRGHINSLERGHHKISKVIHMAIVAIDNNWSLCNELDT